MFGLTVNLNVFNLTDGRGLFHRAVHTGLRDRAEHVVAEAVGERAEARLPRRGLLVALMSAFAVANAASALAADYGQLVLASLPILFIFRLMGGIPAGNFDWILGAVPLLIILKFGGGALRPRPPKFGNRRRGPLVPNRRRPVAPLRWPSRWGNVPASE